MTRNGQLRNNSSNLKNPIRYEMDLENLEKEEDFREITGRLDMDFDASQK